MQKKKDFRELSNLLENIPKKLSWIFDAIVYCGINFLQVLFLIISTLADKVSQYN